MLCEFFSNFNITFLRLLQFMRELYYRLQRPEELQSHTDWWLRNGHLTQSLYNHKCHTALHIPKRLIGEMSAIQLTARATVSPLLRALDGRIKFPKQFCIYRRKVPFRFVFKSSSNRGPMFS